MVKYESKTAKKKREAFERGQAAYDAYANTHYKMLDLENAVLQPGNKTYSETEEGSGIFHIVRIISIDHEKGMFTCHEDNGGHTSEEARSIIRTLPLRCIYKLRME